MKLFLIIPLFLASLVLAEDAKKERLTNTVILDEAGVKNLRIETVEAEETTFEETLFALGRIGVLPGQKAIVSSRIPGRATSVLALPDREVKAGDELMSVESRQPGDPPPTIKISAPMSGLVAKVDIAIGQPVTPDQSLMEILNLDTVEAVAHVPEHLMGRLAKGQRAHIRVPGLPDKVFEAELSHLGAYANAESSTVEAAFHVANPGHLLRPGMRAEFNVVLSQRENVMSIPRAALQGDAAGRFVYVKDFDLKNAFVKIPVVVGQINDRFVEVTSGLLPGDEVVTRGGYSLAFAGKGSVSLKEALDAAHGHEHNEDGTEKGSAAPGAAHDHDHDHGGGDDHDHEESDWNTLTILFAASTGILLVLLIVATLRRKEVAA